MSILAAPNFYNQADQNIYNQGFSFVPQERFRGGAFNIPTTTEDSPTGITTLPTAMNMSGVGSGGSGNFSTDQLLKNYTLDTRKQYFGSQPTPLVDDLYQSKLDKTFMGFPSYRQQELTGADMGEYIGSDTDIPLEQTTAGKIQSSLGNVKDTASGIMNNIKNFGPISMMLGSVDKFNTLSPSDQEFIKQNMGYTGPTVFGPNDSGLSKDIFGINTRSAFGNYADFVSEKATSLGDMLSGKMADKYDVEFDPITGQFIGKNAAYANKMNKMNLAKYNYYTQKEKERVANEKLMAEKAALESRLESQKQYDPAVHGPNNYGLGSDGQQSFDTGQGFGANATTGGPVSNRTGRGRTDYMDGGLANLVDIYD
tara:strand:- start:8 stop:1114 length:1107 start_codon:yes stop_codon:yes gene_type:complete